MTAKCPTCAAEVILAPSVSGIITVNPEPDARGEWSLRRWSFGWDAYRIRTEAVLPAGTRRYREHNCEEKP